MDNAGFLHNGGNATITPPPPGPVPGIFIIRATGSDEVWWLDPAGSSKRPVGSCTPCPGVNACKNVTRVPDAAFDRIANATGDVSRWRGSSCVRAVIVRAPRGDALFAPILALPRSSPAASWAGKQAA